MSHTQALQSAQSVRVQLSNIATFVPGDLVKVYESRYKRALHSQEYDNCMLGIVLSYGMSRHYHRVLLFVRHYDTGEITMETHYRNIEMYKKEDRPPRTNVKRREQKK